MGVKCGVSQHRKGTGRGFSEIRNEEGTWAQEKGSNMKLEKTA